MRKKKRCGNTKIEEAIASSTLFTIMYECSIQLQLVNVSQDNLNQVLHQYSTSLH